MKNRIGILFMAMSSRLNPRTGEAPIYMRITVNGQRTEISTGRYIDPKKWDKKTHKAKGKSEYAETLNTFLRNVETQILSIRNSLFLEVGEDAITTEQIASRFKGVPLKKEHTILEAFDYHNEMVRKGVDKLADRTYGRYLLTERRLKEFIKKDLKKADVYLSDVNPEFYDRFIANLAKVPNCNHNGIAHYLKQLKCVVNKAVALGWTDRSLIEKCKSNEKPSNRVALNEYELRSIEEMEIHHLLIRHPGRSRIIPRLNRTFSGIQGRQDYLL